jgi:hypothetical protein
VAGRERDDVVADGVQTFELGSKEDGPRCLARPTHVESGDSNGVACGDYAVLFLVVENPGEHAVEVSRRVDVMLEILDLLDRHCSHASARPHQRNDDLAIRVCLEVVWLLEALAEDSVVVDFAIDSQRDSLLLVDERLSARVYGCELLPDFGLGCGCIPTPTMLKRSWTRTAYG